MILEAAPPSVLLVVMRLSALAAAAAPLVLLSGCTTFGDVLAPDRRLPFPQGWTIVDLTRPVDSHAPYLPREGAFPFERVELPGHGTALWRGGGYSILEQAGTHLAAPAARAESGATTESLQARDLILPLVVVDVPEVGDMDSNGTVTVEFLRAHEIAHGAIPLGSAVVLRTGRGAIPSSDPRYSGRTQEGRYSFPGWTPDAVRFLVKNRGVRIVGTDAPAIDPGDRFEEAPAQTAGSEAGGWFLVNLGDLRAMPNRGAQLLVGVIPVVGGTGAQARVLGMVPAEAAQPDQNGTPSR